MKSRPLEIKILNNEGKKFISDKELAWHNLKAQLLEGRYKPQPIKAVDIPKPGGGTRRLGIPTVLDRFIQQALLQVMIPVYDPTFSPHSYGFRPGRNAHQARLLEHHPSINRYIVSDASIFRKLLSEKPYDLAIDLCATRTSRLISKISGAPLRLWGKFRKAPSRFFYSDSLNPARPPLEIMIKNNVYKRRNSYRVAPFLEIIQFLGGRAPENPVTEIYLDRREKNYAQILSKKIKNNCNCLVGIQPGGRDPGRLWPARHYAYLADKLIERRGASVVLFHGPQEKSYVRSVCEHSRHNLFKVCEKDIRKYASMISACDLFITTDGGPLHLALSLGVPSVGIFKARDIASYWYHYKNRKGLFSALVKKDERGLVLERAEEALLSRTR